MSLKELKAYNVYYACKDHTAWLLTLTFLCRFNGISIVHSKSFEFKLRTTKEGKYIKKSIRNFFLQNNKSLYLLKNLGLQRIEM